MKIQVEAWIVEEATENEEVGYYGYIEKNVCVGMGASVPVTGGRFGRYNVWCEIVEVRDDINAVKLKCGGHTGWVPGAIIADVLPHNEYILLEAGAMAGEAALKFFNENAATETHGGSWDNPTATDVQYVYPGQ